MNQFARYEKQMLFKPIGRDGQAKLARSRVGIIGIGALGTNLGNLCARSGVGNLILVDSDRVELSNLQRQMLFSEADVGSLKAAKAAEKLAEINSEINIEAFCQRLDCNNIYDIFKGCDLILDGTDNFPTRFIVNQMALKTKTPWVHTGVTASSGQSMLIVPGKTACLGCLIPELTDAANFPTVNNSGIINTIVTAMASISVATALRFLVEKHIDYSLKCFDIWEQRFDSVLLERNLDCPHCRSRL